MDSRSAWPHRTPIAALALLAGGISVYLSLYQCDVMKSVWDPLFGERSSEAVLTSAVSRSLPVPDAALGAVAYATEAALVLAGGSGRRRPRLAALATLAVNALALGGVAQILVQALVVGRFCALCLSTAGISFLNAWLARAETGATLKEWWGRLRGSKAMERLLMVDTA
jgi:uncharacterized membrane protein